MEETVAAEKRREEYVEALGPVQTHIENEEIARFSQEHRDYLFQRHGTLELDPVPDASDADPYNWPSSRASLSTIESTRRLLTSGIENHEPHTRGLSRYDGYLYRFRYPVRVPSYCSRP